MSATNESSRNLWCNALLGAIGLIVLLSLLMITPPYPSIQYFNFILFGQTGFPGSMSQEGVSYIKFIYAVLGCVMIGWMVPLIYLVHGPLRAGSTVAWKVTAISIGVWFVIDSAVSILLGYWQNAVSNVSLTVLIAIPLLMIRSRLQQT